MTTNRLSGNARKDRCIEDRLSEEDVIALIRRRIPSSPDGTLRLGIGDDAAVLRPAAGTQWVVTTDQFLENVHFRADTHPPEVVGYKALARATSDLAAMGARPRVFLLSLALSRSRTGAWLDAVSAGMGRAARQFHLRLAGGDTAQNPAASTMTSFSLTVIGDIKTGRAVRRDTAHRGDAIFVTGTLGAAQLGLHLLLHPASGKHGISPERRRRLLAKQFYPRPRLELGCWLARLRLASAMMDLSDGLSTDLVRLCAASRVGARLYEKDIPGVAVPPELREARVGKASRGESLETPRSLALHGGEDYELLFTVRPEDVSRIPSAFRGTRITRIGEIVPSREITLVAANGRASRLESGGWDHFRNRR